MKRIRWWKRRPKLYRLKVEQGESLVITWPAELVREEMVRFINHLASATGLAAASIVVKPDPVHIEGTITVSANPPEREEVR